MKEKNIIQFIIIFIPAGLIISGVLSLTYTHWYKIKYKPKKNLIALADKKREDINSLKRKGINYKDLENYEKIIKEKIGPRDFKNYINLEKTSFWIQSTMGENNFGYNVKKQEYYFKEKKLWNIISEMPGKSNSNDVIIVACSYDSLNLDNNNGNDIALFLSLARSLTGEITNKTIRFIAFSASKSKKFGNSSGTQVYLNKEYIQNVKDKKENITFLLAINPISFIDKKNNLNENSLYCLINKDEDEKINILKKYFSLHSGIRMEYKNNLDQKKYETFTPFYNLKQDKLFILETIPYYYKNNLNYPNSLTLEKIALGLKSIINEQDKL